ncbi:MAG: ABC transporter ATP-binding protein [Erysipelotrichaceae bacterium]|nr:ABC transporter ATP-binding protein [Erysipelotrichaceae bacterium]
MLTNKYLLKYIKKYWYLIFIGISADIFVDVIQLLVPEYLGDVVNIVGGNDNPVYEMISPIIFKLVLVAFGLFFGRLIMRLGNFRSSALIEKEFRHEMFEKAERLSQRYYHENKTGTIMSWFSSDLETITEFTGWGVIMIVDALFLSLIALIKMIRLDYVLTIIVLIPMAALIIWGNFAERFMSDRWDARQKAFDSLYDFTQENFTGIRVIKAFVKEVQEIHAFSKVAKDNMDKNLDFSKCSVTLDVCIELIIGFVIALIMGVGSYFVYCCSSGGPFVLFNHEVVMSAGSLTTFVGYADTLIWPMIAMGQIVSMSSRCKASLNRVSLFLDQDEEIHNCDNPLKLDECKGSIEFKDFSFKYPGSNTHSLENISFKIEPGEMIGIVGKIGSGKTTLVNSLLRLYNVEDNTILIDDKNIMDIDIEDLRNSIAYVPQDNFLFSDNIKNNISFYNKSLDMEKIRTAAKFADVDDNIMEFSKGYETMMGEMGVTLSGGQKQRISIARAYIKDAPIMIMDDSVSAVDVKTEETILNNIMNKRKGKTTIIIASRVSTVSRLDKILVLNEGKLEAFDTPENLMKISPSYQKMVFLQKLESEL